MLFSRRGYVDYSEKSAYCLKLHLVKFFVNLRVDGLQGKYEQRKKIVAVILICKVGAKQLMKEYVRVLNCFYRNNKTDNIFIEGHLGIYVVDFSMYIRTACN